MQQNTAKAFTVEGKCTVDGIIFSTDVFMAKTKDPFVH